MVNRTCVAIEHSFRGFIDTLKDLVHTEENPTVLSNTIAALSEICRSRTVRPLHLDVNLVQKLCNVLQQCTE